MSNTTFLEKLALHLHTKYENNLSNICIVLPNRRAALFLKTYLSKNIGKTFWAPEIVAIEDFISNLSGLQPADTIACLFELYEVVIASDNSKKEPFDDFCKWGQILLNDFNEIDKYCVSANDLFLNLKDYKELESFSFNSDELTDFQKQYLHFFKSLATYYNVFTAKLLEKRMAYQGLSYKTVVEQYDKIFANLKWDKIVFAGFNALNKAEEKIILKLLEQDKAEMIFDVDLYYSDNTNQEAGYFFRKHKNDASFRRVWNKCTVFEEDLLSNDKKNIEVIGVAKNIAQAKIGGEIIKSLFDSEKNLSQTALVLADEKLLFPVLHSLPQELSDINITMGYPLKSTPLAGFINLYISLHENAQKISQKKINYSYYHADIIRLFSHPYMSYVFSGKNSPAKKMIKHIVEKNIIFASYKSVERFSGKFSAEEVQKLLFFFSYFENTGQTLTSLIDLIEILKNGIITVRNADTSNKTSLELEYLFAYLKNLNRIKSLINDFPDGISDLKTLKNIINQIVRSTALPFYGEPMLGLQIMGMLETRTLDFDNVILLSCNEDVLPSAKTQNSFIPYELKRYFKLPTHSDKDAIFAYHFYRLLQRAKNVFLIHNTETNELGNGEKSRYLTQLIYELPQQNKNITINEKILTYPVAILSNENEITIAKTPEIISKINQLSEVGYSPTMLSRYISCSLKFYFHAIAHLREDEEVEETIGADTLGEVVHEVLELLYKPFIGKLVLEKDVRDMINWYESLVVDSFKKKYDESELMSGKNLLIMKVAGRFVLNFLKHELSNFTKNKKHELKIIDLEKKLESTIDVNDKQIKINGKADRIDFYDNTLRIIDYKTGFVEEKKLKLEEINELLKDSGNDKSFQLLMYAYLYDKSSGKIANTYNSGIISFRKMSRGLFSVTVNKSATISEDTLSQFESVLKNVIAEIEDINVPFVKTSIIKTCEYCSFKTICNR